MVEKLWLDNNLDWLYSKWYVYTSLWFGWSLGIGHIFHASEMLLLRFNLQILHLSKKILEWKFDSFIPARDLPEQKMFW